MHWRRLLTFVAPILLLAQIALIVHQFEHRVDPDLATPAHECALCSIANSAAPPPTPFVFTPPSLEAVPVLWPVAVALRIGYVGSSFYSRGPPLSVAV